MTPIKIQVQSILFNNEPADIKRALEAINRAAHILRGKRDVVVDVAYGDCSPGQACLSPEDVRQMGAMLTCGVFHYTYFNANLGSAEGHNRLAAAVKDGYLLIQNPDVIGEPSYLIHLLEAFDDPDCGMSEARQLPIEHPKDYDSKTGSTSWATTACALIPVDLFVRVSGFDSKVFFLYCDDVDFSWRVRLADRKVVFQPAAVVFHDKRLKKDGSWNPSNAERYYSIEAALLMAHKYSRPQRVEEILQMCDHLSSDDVFSKAAARFRELRRDGKLPQALDHEHRVSEFYGDDYARHRFVI
ncbi:glycosyltransferase family protein [Burkholderia cepacia]|uniref:glycosyltransferase family 2 protein n=1 Tax=Burkholderia cepacia TaxID=292 RepID=UPI001CF11BB2|nr:glycosyltransferase family 2 protein [Burkholderia cepacia]MCA8077995.1 glycosyltransferase family 2 protein [Burkholderia cepacia]